MLFRVKEMTPGFLLALWFLLSIASLKYPGNVWAQQVQSPAGPPYSTPSSPPAAANAMDEPLRLIGEARRAYEGVRDYSCLFIKRERIRGVLQPENLIEMKVRSQPFSVYLHWLAPPQTAGQEACYVQGQNNGMMRVHSTGLAGAIGFISLDPRDPRAAQNSRHTITEAGIGNLIERYCQRWAAERQIGRTQVRIAEYVYAQRPCTRAEMIHPDRATGNYMFYRSVVYFDKEWHLPVRVENYDWPQNGGPGDGQLLESYSYVNLRFNMGLTDRAFNY
jgi:hypothetical protein